MWTARFDASLKTVARLTDSLIVPTDPLLDLGFGPISFSAHVWHGSFWRVSPEVAAQRTSMRMRRLDQKEQRS